jgi:hypothetical protein
MATKRYDPAATDFNGRYSRWVAALESGDEAELLEATVALPSLNKRVLKKLAAVDRDEPDPSGAGGAEARDRAAQRDQRQHEAATPRT